MQQATPININITEVHIMYFICVISFVEADFKAILVHYIFTFTLLSPYCNQTYDITLCICV